MRNGSSLWFRACRTMHFAVRLLFNDRCEATVVWQCGMHTCFSYWVRMHSGWYRKFIHHIYFYLYESLHLSEQGIGQRIARPSFWSTITLMHRFVFLKTTTMLYADLWRLLGLFSMGLWRVLSIVKYSVWWKIIGGQT